MKKARIAVIGTGWWATYTHLPALANREDVEIVALANRGPQKLQLAAQAFNVSNTYTDYQEMLDRERLDGVIVAAQHDVHYDAAKSSLLHGCHVLVEKPLVLKAEEAVELLDLARRGDRQIVMSYPNSYTPYTRRAREAVRSGEIGEVEMVSSLFSSFAYETYRGDTATLDRFFGAGGAAEAPIVRPRDDANTDPAAGGGQGFCQVTHSAALMLLVTGLAVERVSAFMSRLDVQVDVVDAINMRMTNGAVGVVSSTGHIRPGDPGEHLLAVYGSAGWLLLDMVAGTLAIKRFNGAEEKRDPLPAPERFPRFAPANNLADVILYGAENLAPGEFGCATVFFLDAVYKSAASGGIPVEVYRP